MISRSLEELRTRCLAMGRYTGASRRPAVTGDSLDMDVASLQIRVTRLGLEPSKYNNTHIIVTENLDIFTDELVYGLWKGSVCQCSFHGDEYEIQDVPLVAWVYVFQKELESRGL